MCCVSVTVMIGYLQAQIYVFASLSKAALRRNIPPTSPVGGINWLRRETNHSLQYRAQVKELIEICLHSAYALQVQFAVTWGNKCCFPSLRCFLISLLLACSCPTALFVSVFSFVSLYLLFIFLFLCFYIQFLFSCVKFEAKWNSSCNNCKFKVFFLFLAY